MLPVFEIAVTMERGSLFGRRGGWLSERKRTRLPLPQHSVRLSNPCNMQTQAYLPARSAAAAGLQKQPPPWCDKFPLKRSQSGRELGAVYFIRVCTL
jgi:hypothetical protein